MTNWYKKKESKIYNKIYLVYNVTILSYNVYESEHNLA